MMDIKELIEQLNARGLSNGSSLGYHCGLFDEAATALSTLQAENNKLRDDVIRFNDILASYQNVLVPELRAELKQKTKAAQQYQEDWYDSVEFCIELQNELEKVKAERDAAISAANELDKIIGRAWGEED